MLPDGMDTLELLPATTCVYHELAWLPGNRIAFMTCDGQADFGVFTPDPGDENRTRLPAPDGGYERIAWSSDGTRIAYINSNGDSRELYVMKVADGMVRQLTDSGGDEWKPAWSPAGHVIAYSRWNEASAGSSLYVINADSDAGSEPQRVYSGPDADWLMRIDDGRCVAWRFRLGHSGDSEIGRMATWMTVVDGRVAWSASQV